VINTIQKLLNDGTIILNYLVLSPRKKQQGTTGGISMG
jgi:hypothetical protein